MTGLSGSAYRHLEPTVARLHLSCFQAVKVIVSEWRKCKEIQQVNVINP